MQRYIDAVREFHIVMKRPTRQMLDGSPSPSVEEFALRTKLVPEELHETMHAIQNLDRVEFGDGVADSLYVLAGTNVQFGLPDPDFQKVSMFLLDDISNRFIIATHRYQVTGDVESSINLANVIFHAGVLLRGLAATFGIPYEIAFDIVHKTNMAKAPGGVVTYDENGKVMKPPGWTPPTKKLEELLGTEPLKPVP